MAAVWRAQFTTLAKAQSEKASTQCDSLNNELITARGVTTACLEADQCSQPQPPEGRSKRINLSLRIDMKYEINKSSVKIFG
ncbi:hypothetical protein ElyMa_003632600 [Elysia marginata]|uniref:Uncharacterized protein n=1 Tax=Elysia marginata TaxID=1093978 RepID=A0AAV4EU36_9GAST|nr:hypothetical protein ElyMa_003632600 [Elysia marginata]